MEFDSERISRNLRRSVSSLKIGFLSFPRLVTWYRAPGNWMRSGLAMSFSINHIGKSVKDKDLTPFAHIGYLWELNI